MVIGCCAILMLTGSSHCQQEEPSPHRRFTLPPYVQKIDNVAAPLLAPPAGIATKVMPTASTNEPVYLPEHMGPGGPDHGLATCNYSEKFIPEVNVDTEPEPLAPPKALYTDEARAHRVEGAVILQALVAPDGEVCRVKVLQGLVHGLDEQAIQATYGMRFEPAKKDGKNVVYWQRVEIEFKMDKSK